MQTMTGRTIRGSQSTNRSGVALLYALFAVIVAGGLIAMTMAAASVTHRNTQVKRFDMQAQYLAEGAVETAKKQVQLTIANWGAVPTGGTAQVGGLSIPYTIQATGFSTINTDPTGIQTVVTGYELDSTASARKFSRLLPGAGPSPR